MQVGKEKGLQGALNTSLIVFLAGEAMGYSPNSPRRVIGQRTADANSLNHH